MEKQDLTLFLKFRKKFSKKEWYELQKEVDAQIKEKADKLELDDSDINSILQRFELNKD